MDKPVMVPSSAKPAIEPPTEPGSIHGAGPTARLIIPATVFGEGRVAGPRVTDVEPVRRGGGAVAHAELALEGKRGDRRAVVDVGEDDLGPLTR